MIRINQELRINIRKIINLINCLNTKFSTVVADKTTFIFVIHDFISLVIIFVIKLLLIVEVKFDFFIFASG